MTPLDQQCAHVQLLVRFCSRTTRLSRHVNPQTWNQCPRCHMDLPTQQIHLWCHWWKIHYHRARQHTLLVNQDKLSTTRHNHLMVSYPCLNCGSHLWETGLFFKSFLFTNQQKRGDGLPHLSSKQLCEPLLGERIETPCETWMVAEPVDRYRARDPRWAMASDVPANIDPNITALRLACVYWIFLMLFLLEQKKRELWSF